jgi:hypothetical protein
MEVSLGGAKILMARQLLGDHRIAGVLGCARTKFVAKGVPDKTFVASPADSALPNSSTSREPWASIPLPPSLTSNVASTPMAVDNFLYGIEPDDLNAPIWRFLEFWKFEDLMRGHMYFHRADLYEDNDPHEGLPLDNYQTGRHPLDINDIRSRDSELGFDAQIRQSFYICCWYLAGSENAKMWRTYAAGNGVAVCSTYAKLKAVLEALPAEDKAHLGLVQYGDKHIPPGRRNLIMNIGTKRERYKDEKEVRAMLWLVDPHETGNRNIDSDNRPHPRPLDAYPTNNPEGVHRPVDLQTLLTEVVVSPFADANTKESVEQLLRDAGCPVLVKQSDMTSRKTFIPTAEELKRLGL